ncbi:alkene reductase [Engelhardtia mirabilis]|uniref:N-ethylmaleimide reductase n=1 Tax=Engelhardtia mirabilis TaxID=2528011 RepID=A0A518BMD8_9BACT|nr:N-ethylmaleimide reductase [Planctomycetes bacterium Pla133]QDV02449.1 N-ethylmaleimide reductase [Planctomycetes bacterium Pla86]
MTSNPDRALFGSVTLGDLPLSNRIVLAPMTRGRAGSERLANPVMAEYYAQRSGAGLVLTEATTVSAQGNGWVGSPGIYTDEQGQAWRQVVDAVHARGGRIFLQLWHTGRASHSSFHAGELPVAPSAIRMEGEGVHTPLGKQPHETPRALEQEELPGIVADYVSAARRALAAGFDGVEVHSANGYLLDEFLQSRTNHRTDAYGGSLENRYRLLREVVEAVTQVFPAGRVGVRLSPNGVFNDMGSPDFRETFLYAAGQLDRFGLAYLHVMDGLAFGFHGLGEPLTLKDFRGVFHGTLMGNCGYDLEQAEAAVDSGAADLIAFGRPFIANPDLVQRLELGLPLAESDPSTWYLSEDPATGYTDYPVYREEVSA